MRAWAGPVFGRNDGKRDTLLGLEDRAERLDRFYALVRSSGEKIHFLLKVGKKKKNICLRHMSDGLRVSSTFHHSVRLLCSQQFLICFESFTVIFFKKKGFTSCHVLEKSGAAQRGADLGGVEGLRGIH